MLTTTNARPAAVLFDLDGTLLDTAPDLGGALNQLLSQTQRPPVAAAAHGANGMLELGFGRDYFSQNKSQLRQAFLDLYEQKLAHHTTLFEGVDELLASLRDSNIKIAIVTNKPGYLTQQLIPHFDAFANIEVVVSGDTLPVAKPAPEP